MTRITFIGEYCWFCFDYEFCKKNSSFLFHFLWRFHHPLIASNEIDFPHFQFYFHTFVYLHLMVRAKDKLKVKSWPRLLAISVWRQYETVEMLKVSWDITCHLFAQKSN